MLHFVSLLLLVAITLAGDVTYIQNRFQGWLDGDKISVKLRFSTDSPADVIIYEDTGYTLENRTSRLRVHVSRNFYRVYDYKNETELDMKHTQKVNDTDVALTLANGTVSVKINDGTIVQLPTPIFETGRKFRLTSVHRIAKEHIRRVRSTSQRA
uniref:Secreted protein n=1 Tax=Bursaphelenchus xylophilus TaxID=6326 RepID=A0A1I7SJH1_BURXY